MGTLACPQDTQHPLLHRHLLQTLCNLYHLLCLPTAPPLSPTCPGCHSTRRSLCVPPSFRGGDRDGVSLRMGTVTGYRMGLSPFAWAGREGSCKRSP